MTGISDIGFCLVFPCCLIFLQFDKERCWFILCLGDLMLDGLNKVNEYHPSLQHSCVPVLRKESQQIGLTEAVVDPSGHFVAFFVVNRGRDLLGMSLGLINIVSTYL